jgi:putative ABC transport system permease protein
MLLYEIRHGVRALLRVPGLTAISVLTLALGVGAGTALFSVVKGVLLDPLPYTEPDRLAWLAEINESGRPMSVAFQNFLDWREQNRTFSAMAAFGEGPFVVAGGDLPHNSYGAAVTADFFRVLGVDAALGRTFLPEEHVPGGPLVVVLGHGLWQRAFGGAPDVIGRGVRVAGMAATVVGVMPPGFRCPETAELWMPASAFGDPGINVRTAHNWRVIGRLRPGVPVSRAQTDVGAIERRIKQQYPSPFQGKDASVLSLQSHIVGEVRAPVLMLFGAVGFVILIVCVNVANLLLVRVTARGRELAVRTALGAGRGDLFRQLLGESLLLATAGGACGLLLAAWSMDLLRSFLPADMPRAGDIHMDPGVIAFGLAVSAAAGVLFGFLPAWRAAAMNVNDALKAGSRSATRGRQSHRTQSALVVSEACLSLVLVAGAGLLARSFWNLRSVDPGFRADHVLAVTAQFDGQNLGSLVAQYRDLLTGVRTLPGVEAAAIARGLPIEASADGHFSIEGRIAESGEADAIYSVVSPGYLKALRIPLLRGRDFTDQDTATSRPAAIISAEMARIYFPGRDPIGQRIWFDSFNPKEHWLTIVGVAGDVRQEGLTRPVFPQAYVCYTQQTLPQVLSEAVVVVRSAIAPAALSAPVRAAVRKVNPDAAPSARTMDAVLASSVAKQRFQMEILGGFAGLALLLAAIGLYGVLSHMVTANRAEIGIRLALGAPRSFVFRMVTGRALGLAGLGVLIGVLGCFAVRRVLATLLFGIGPNDPATLAAAGAILLSVALAASWLPAARAARVDPIDALRDE